MNNISLPVEVNVKSYLTVLWPNFTKVIMFFSNDYKNYSSVPETVQYSSNWLSVAYSQAAEHHSSYKFQCCASYKPLFII